ncbi:MAG: hypothetical protein ACRBCL_14925 [Maritimibacter sp.]
MSRLALGLGLVLAGCGATGAMEKPAPRQGVTFTPDAQGLGIENSAMRVDFGRSPKGVIPVMTREMGEGKTLALTGCPVGVVQQIEWDGLTLSFTSERFVGWKSATARAGQSCA